MTSSSLRNLFAAVLDYLMPQPEAFDERTYWSKVYRNFEHTNYFTCSFKRITSSPSIKVEADGFEPVLMALPAYSQTNLAIQLVPRPGISGKVLLPDGKPAAGAIVAYAAAREHFGLLNGVLTAYGGNNEALHATDSNGVFSFPLRAEGKCLYVANPAGWNFHKLSGNDQDLVLQLQPWASVSGAMPSTGKDANAAVKLAITMDDEDSAASKWQTSEPLVDLQARAITDSNGRFIFRHIPPFEHVLLQRLLPSDERSAWRYKPLVHVFVAGTNLDVVW